MKPRKWTYPVSLCILAAYVALYYAGEGERWIAPRKLALSLQLSTSLTGLTPKLILAAAVLLLTARFGRWYCRLLCPAGTVQEFFSRRGARIGLRRLRHASAPDKALLLIVIGTATLFGMRTLAQFTDPAGLFGRIVTPMSWTDTGQPLVLAIAVAGGVLLFVLPLFKGRLFCDRFCPVGALLGIAAQARSGNTPFIDKDKCVSCGKCEPVCPVQCIDPKAKTIAPVRCLACGECAPLCPAGAIALPEKSAPAAGTAAQENAAAPARRSFLTSAAVGAAGVFALSRPASAVFGRESPTPMITPPGTGGDVRHRQFCIGCQACVAACPMRIIRPKNGSDMRPVLDYDRGFCHYNCRACLDSCPAHAFDESITLEERQRIRVARVALDLPRCVVLHNNTACGACAEVCPTHALRMVDQGKGGDRPTIPDFSPEHCIGCGACYHACPAEPRAFVLQGLNTHETSRGVRPALPQEEETAPKTLSEPGEFMDFPF